MNNLQFKKSWRFFFIPYYAQQGEAGFIIFHLGWLWWKFTWTKDFEV